MGKQKSLITAETQFKKWVLNHHPDRIKKRKDYANSEKVKFNRSKSNKRRRTTSTALINLVKSESLADEQGNTYQIINSRLVKIDEDGNKFVVRSDKGGNLDFMSYEKDDDLLSERFDEKKETKTEVERNDYIKKLLKGDPEVEVIVQNKKTLVPFQLKEEDMYWRTLTDTQKKELLEKIEKN
jgi:hypothetical protein